jgi:hypothetical protein
MFRGEALPSGRVWLRGEGLRRWRTQSWWRRTASPREAQRDRPMIGSRLRTSCQATMTLVMTCMLVQMP